MQCQLFFAVILASVTAHLQPTPVDHRKDITSPGVHGYEVEEHEQEQERKFDESIIPRYFTIDRETRRKLGNLKEVDSDIHRLYPGTLSVGKYAAGYDIPFAENRKKNAQRASSEGIIDGYSRSLHTDNGAVNPIKQTKKLFVEKTVPRDLNASEQGSDEQDPSGAHFTNFPEMSNQILASNSPLFLDISKEHKDFELPGESHPKPPLSLSYDEEHKSQVLEVDEEQISPALENDDAFHDKLQGSVNYDSYGPVSKHSGTVDDGLPISLLKDNDNPSTMFSESTPLSDHNVVIQDSSLQVTQDSTNNDNQPNPAKDEEVVYIKPHEGSSYEESDLEESSPTLSFTSRPDSTLQHSSPDGIALQDQTKSRNLQSDDLLFNHPHQIESYPPHLRYLPTRFLPPELFLREGSFQDSPAVVKHQPVLYHVEHAVLDALSNLHQHNDHQDIVLPPEAILHPSLSDLLLPLNVVSGLSHPLDEAGLHLPGLNDLPLVD